MSHVSYIISNPPSPAQQIIPANLKPFNLEAALAGDPVVTRNGLKATQLVKFDAPLNNRQPLRAVIGGQIQAFYLNGSSYSNGISVNDLFMAKKERTVYVNLYTDRGSDGLHDVFSRSGYAYDNKEQAEKHATPKALHVAVPLTIFE